MKLLIGVPTAGSPAKPFLESLATLQLPAAVTSVDRMTVGGNFVPAQREIMLRAARGGAFDAVAMFDDDMVLPPDALVRLFEIFEADPRCGVAGALYYSRDGLRPMAVSGWDPLNTTSGWTPAFDDRTPVKVDGVGFGCVLIRASVLEGLPQPFLRTQIFIQEQQRMARLCNEDYLFCTSVRENGYFVYMHPGVRCGHYDRASAQIVPRSWETPDRTMHERMTVARPDGGVELVPLDRGMPQASEVHVPAQLDYIYETRSAAN